MLIITVMVTAMLRILMHGDKKISVMMIKTLRMTVVIMVIMRKLMQGSCSSETN